MGLDTTHDCWSGSYTSFMKFRRAVAFAAGIDIDSMAGFGSDRHRELEMLRAQDLERSLDIRLRLRPPAIPWANVDDPIKFLLDHPDSDGDIAVEHLVPLADRLEEISPRIDDCWRAQAAQFVRGLRAAAAAGEAVEFH